ncbi:hypothetical protein TKK_0011440 [Trichogramma kaykai]|uniref:Hcy-binding domain-containing protein n=1 Tax=Trichogramma kaykai TaxID=54128 RepID=A0ABD2WR07_9HYME
MIDTDVKVLAAGIANTLEKHVEEEVDNHPLWASRYLSSKPEAVYKTHLDFLNAGSDVFSTFTYQASVAGFVEHQKTSEAEAVGLIKRSVELAKRAIRDYKLENRHRLDRLTNPEPLVAGSVGSYAAYLHDGSEYSGPSYAHQKNLDHILEWHKMRIDALVEAGADFLAIETCPAAREAQLLLDYLGAHHPEAKAWVAFSCKNDGKSIVDGSSFKETALQLYRKSKPGQLIGLGANCIPPKDTTPLLKSLSQRETGVFIPLVAYPNSGETFCTETGKYIKSCVHYPPEEFVKEWLDLGVRYIGGCCRTTTDDIKRVSTQVQNWKKLHSPTT